MKLTCECGKEIKLNPYGKTYDSNGLDPEGAKIMRMENVNDGNIFSIPQLGVYFYCDGCNKEYIFE